jgi:predicted nucleic acid-binding protein
MITAIDTNVLIALWDTDDALNNSAQAALEAAFARGGMLISGTVFAELLAAPHRSEKFIDDFLTDLDIAVDWITDEAIWRTAAKAFQNYVKRRRKSAATYPRRLLADFVIGAHAMERGFSLLTLDQRHYKAAFPQLKVIGV